MTEIEVVVPKLYEDLESGVLLEWFKKAGDRVQAGDPIFSLETDKAVFDVEAEVDGYIKDIRVQCGSTVRVMDVLAVMTTEKP